LFYVKITLNLFVKESYNSNSYIKEKPKRKYRQLPTPELLVLNIFITVVLTLPPDPRQQEKILELYSKTESLSKYARFRILTITITITITMSVD